jgi:peptidoglycan/xylan/chitin deacetylase (PgdA/CDA1 family)
MTRYVAAYDTESGECLAACRRIIEVHKRHGMPATFFLTGRVLEADGAEYGRLLGDPLFETASHGYSHRMLKDHPFCGPAVPVQAAREEIVRGKELVEQVFGRPCLGMRTACAFEDGMKGAREALGFMSEAGLRYVSSMAWGRDYSLPAPLNQPFTYEAEGFPGIWELPAHGWHDNLLKDNNGWGPRRLTLWPPEMPEAIPPRFLATPEEEFAVNRVFIERAVRDGLKFVSLIWHPWSLARFDPEMRMLELTFAHVRELRMKVGTYAELLKATQSEES